MKEFSIMGVSIDNRKKMAPRVQEIFTKYGDNIVSRFGVHDPAEEDKGIITLHLLSNQKTINEFSEELSALEGVTVKTITME